MTSRRASSSWKCCRLMLVKGGEHTEMTVEMYSLVIHRYDRNKTVASNLCTNIPVCCAQHKRLKELAD